MSNARTEGSRAVPSTRGVVFMHCCPSALAPHVEWALAGVLGRPARLQWTGQPAAPTHLRSEAAWVGPVGTGVEDGVTVPRHLGPRGFAPLGTLGRGQPAKAGVEWLQSSVRNNPVNQYENQPMRQLIGAITRLDVEEVRRWAPVL